MRFWQFILLELFMSLAAMHSTNNVRCAALNIEGIAKQKHAAEISKYLNFCLNEHSLRKKKSLCASRWRGKREIGYNFWRTITHVCIVQYFFVYKCFAWIVNLLISHFLWLYLCHKFLLDALATQKPNSSSKKNL